MLASIIILLSTAVIMFSLSIKFGKMTVKSDNPIFIAPTLLLFVVSIATFVAGNVRLQQMEDMQVKNQK